MTLAIDLLCTKLNSGSKTFNVNLCKYITRKELKFETIIYITKDLYNYIHSELSENKKITYIIKSNFLSISFFRILWLQLILPIDLKIKRIHTLYSPMNISPLMLKLFNIKNVLTLHSNLPWLYFDKMPGSYFRKKITRFLMKSSILNTDRLIVNSNYAFEEIKKILGLEKEKISVSYLGLSELYLNNDEGKSLENFKYNDDYILSIASCVKYHNLLNLLKAFKVLRDTYKIKLKFVLVTQILDKEYFQEINEYMLKNDLKDQILFFNDLDPIFLKKIYKYSQLYVFSSYCEVFGLTSLEAMSQGCNVLLSNSSALPEINQDAADYFDPDNIEDISKKLYQNLFDKNHKSKILENAKNHYKKFTWTKTIDSTLKTIEEVIN